MVTATLLVMHWSLIIASQFAISEKDQEMVSFKFAGKKGTLFFNFYFYGTIQNLFIYSRCLACLDIVSQAQNLPRRKWEHEASTPYTSINIITHFTTLLVQVKATDWPLKDSNPTYLTLSTSFFLTKHRGKHKFERKVSIEEQALLSIKVPQSLLHNTWADRGPKSFHSTHVLPTDFSNFTFSSKCSTCFLSFYLSIC